MVREKKVISFEMRLNPRKEGIKGMRLETTRGTYFLRRTVERDNYEIDPQKLNKFLEAREASETYLNKIGYSVYYKNESANFRNPGQIEKEKHGFLLPQYEIPALAQIESYGNEDDIMRGVEGRTYITINHFLEKDPEDIVEFLKTKGFSMI